MAKTVELSFVIVSYFFVQINSYINELSCIQLKQSVLTKLKFGLYGADRIIKQKITAG